MPAQQANHEELTGNASNQTHNAEVRERVYERIGHHLAQGRSTIVDATFVTQKDQTDMVAFARKRGAQRVEVIHLKTEPRLTKERNRARDRQVPAHPIDRMHT